MKGTTKECLRHYASTLPLSEGKKSRVCIEGFVGCRNDTPRLWFNEKAKPRGIYLTKVRFFLELLGYQVKELVDLQEKQPARYMLGELIVFGGLSLEDAARELQVFDKRYVYYLVNCQGKGRGASLRETRRRKIESLRSRRNSRIENNRARWQKRLTLPRSIARRSSFGDSSVHDLPGKQNTQTDILLDSFEHFSRGMIPLVETLLGKEGLRASVDRELAGRLGQLLINLAST